MESHVNYSVWISKNEFPFDFYNQLIKAMKRNAICFTDSRQSSFHAAILGLQESYISTGFIEKLQSLIAISVKIIIINQSYYLSDADKWKLILTGADEIIDQNSEPEITNTLILRIKRWQNIEEILYSNEIREKIIGKSPVWMNFLRKIIEVSRFSSNPVLLLGESGTGKELAARLIHHLHSKKNIKELILLDCTTLVTELSGSEFYGHEKGAFTGAFSSREGAFALANQGCLFLDEVGELPNSLQAGLLRVIQEGMYKKLGSNTWRKSQFRLICATNKNLKNEIESGHFRQDLYFRIASSVFTLPPLSERTEDIPELANFFFQTELKFKKPPPIDPLVIKFMKQREYRGNIRELKHLVSRMLSKYCGEGPITVSHIPEDEFQNLQNMDKIKLHQKLQGVISEVIATGKNLSQIKEDVSEIAIKAALENSSGNLQLAAKKLDQSVRNLQKIRQKKKLAQN